jgi:Protein of unknown function (DUF3716)
LYNAVVAAANAAAAAPQGLLVVAPRLPVGGQELAPLVHSQLGRAVLVLPGQPISYRPGQITPEQVLMHRPSYINALLIQSRGVVQVPACTRCQRGRGPFPECRRVQGHFGGCCGNCKWPDAAARCVFPITINVDSDSDSPDDDDDEAEDVKPVVRQQDTSRAIEGPGVAAAHPILIE